MSRETDDAQSRLAAIVASSGDAIISKDLTGIITSWNAAAERIFGYTEAEAVGQSIRLIIPADLYQEEEAVQAQVRPARSITTKPSASPRMAGASTCR